ncbi:LysR substrate-binding domain-containing protein [Pseudomonas monteilii]
MNLPSVIVVVMLALMRNFPRCRRKNDPSPIESNPARTMDCKKSEWLSDIPATGSTRCQRQQCRRILGEIQAAEDDLSALMTSPRGRLRVGLTFIAGLPLPVISAFIERYPAIQLDLDFTDRMVDVIDAGFAVNVTTARAIPVMPCSVPCLPSKPRYSTKPADLLNHSCLHYRWQNSGKLYQWPFKKNQAIQAGEFLPVTMVCSNVEALIYLAQAGRGIECVPDFAVKDSLADGRLEKVLSSSLVGGSTFHVVWPSSRQMAPKVRAFVDFVVENFGEGLVTSAQ